MTEFMMIGTTLKFIGEQVLATLLQKATERGLKGLEDQLRAGPAQKAFESAIITAVQRYGRSGTRLPLAEVLLSKSSPLNEPGVTAEIAKILDFNGQTPDYALIGSKWQNSVQNAPAWRDFPYEARLLCEYIRDALQNSPIFQPVFASHDIRRIATGIRETTQVLQTLEDGQRDFLALVDSRFAELIRKFASSSPPIHDQIRVFSEYIEEKTRYFTGRNFLIKDFESFTESNPSGYFIIQGDPGIGKTALVAHLSQTRGYLHHFNIRAEGINRADIFLRNICAQLIARFDLDYERLPPETTQDSGIFSSLLTKAAENLARGEKLVLLVDALDEVDDFGQGGANLLFLPQLLPNNVYILATMRRIPLLLRTDSPLEILKLAQDDVNNLRDIQAFVSLRAGENDMRIYLAAHNLTKEGFTDTLVEKSQGNFMYLRHVLPEIIRGAYQDLDLTSIPAGLQNYYEDHWRRMRGQDETTWLNYKLPIIVVLAIVEEPVPLDLIERFSEVRDRRHIRATLAQWDQFLYTAYADKGDSFEKRWRVYHDSFRAFIASKDEVEGEHVDMKAVHGNIGDILWEHFLETN